MPPRQVDHDQRRQHVAHAFQRILAAEGLGHTSFVRVAAEAGTSVGLIQHYFAHRAELLRFAYEECVRSMLGRVDELVRAGEADGKPISALMADGLGELLPLDQERVTEHRVRQSLLTESLHDPVLACVAREAAAELHLRISTAVDNGKTCGEVQRSVDVRAAASMILATAYGLADALALDRALTPDQADHLGGATPPATSVDDVLRPVLSMVFTGRCHRHDAA